MAKEAEIHTVKFTGLKELMRWELLEGGEIVVELRRKFLHLY